MNTCYYSKTDVNAAQWHNHTTCDLQWLAALPSSSADTLVQLRYKSEFICKADNEHDSTL